MFEKTPTPRADPRKAAFITHALSSEGCSVHGKN
jgi:hypothetical protein